MEARDLMEKIALTKIKFDAPTLNQSDRNNLNIEFMELTEELISIKEKKFNGVSLFSKAFAIEDAISYGEAQKTSIETGEGADGGIGISKHVVDHEDIRNIWEAGDAVRRGKGGLNVINFNPVENASKQRQIERIEIGGSIADGDVFTLNLNELSTIREVYSTHKVTVVADGTDEQKAELKDGPDGTSGTADDYYDFTEVHKSIRDKLISEINALPIDVDSQTKGTRGQWIKAIRGSKF